MAPGAGAARLIAPAITVLAVVAVAGGLRAERAEAVETAQIQLIAFAAPVPGHEVNSPFGLRKLPWEKHGRLHAGVDIAAPRGSPVVATTDGIVSKTGVSPTYGRFVEVAHGSGLTSVYAHLSGTVSGVEPGLPVGEGEKIALVGSSGRSTGPHLHFELRKDGKPLDPDRFTGRSFHADSLPFAEAARISPIVRIAQVAKSAVSRARGRS